MDLKRNRRKIVKVVRKVCKDNGAELIDSYFTIGDINFPKTVSLYFKVRDDNNVFRFRISDHPVRHKNVEEHLLIPSIYISDKTTLKSIKRVVFDRLLAERYGISWFLENCKRARKIEIIDLSQRRRGGKTNEEGL